MAGRCFGITGLEKAPCVGRSLISRFRPTWVTQQFTKATATTWMGQRGGIQPRHHGACKSTSRCVVARPPRSIGRSVARMGGYLGGCREQDDCRAVGDPARCFWGPQVLPRGHQCRSDHATVVARCWPRHMRCGNVLDVSYRHHRGRHLSLEVRGRVSSNSRSVPKVLVLNPIEAAPSPHEPVMKKGLQWQTSGT